MHSLRRLMPFVSSICVAFAGCGGSTVASGPSSIPAFGPSTSVVAPTANADSVAEAEPELTPDDAPIPDRAPPDVSGRYVGKLQDRTPSEGFVARGRVVFTIRQHGSDVSGTLDTTSRGNSGPIRQTFTITGTVAATQKGAILHLIIDDPSGRNDGVWAKAIGSSLDGKGWADPDATKPYEKLVFTTHKT